MPFLKRPNGPIGGGGGHQRSTIAEKQKPTLYDKNCLTVVWADNWRRYRDSRVPEDQTKTFSRSLVGFSLIRKSSCHYWEFLRGLFTLHRRAFESSAQYAPIMFQMIPKNQNIVVPVIPVLESILAMALNFQCVSVCFVFNL